MDEGAQSIPLPAEAPESNSISVPAPAEPVSDQPAGSDPTDTPPVALESSTNAPSTTHVEDQNSPINQPESEGTEEPISAPNELENPNVDQPDSSADESATEPTASPISEPVQSAPVSTPILVSTPTPAPTPLTPTAPQTQSSAQQDEVGFIHSLLNKANAKLLSNRQKKLNKIIQFAQEKKIIKNDDVQKILRVSDATATRYLVKLVQQGRLIRIGSPRDAKYQFVQQNLAWLT